MLIFLSNCSFISFMANIWFLKSSLNIFWLKSSVKRFLQVSFSFALVDESFVIYSKANLYFKSFSNLLALLGTTFILEVKTWQSFLLFLSVFFNIKLWEIPLILLNPNFWAKECRSDPAFSLPFWFTVLAKEGRASFSSPCFFSTVFNNFVVSFFTNFCDEVSFSEFFFLLKLEHVLYEGNSFVLCLLSIDESFSLLLLPEFIEAVEVFKLFLDFILFVDFLNFLLIASFIFKFDSILLLLLPPNIVLFDFR